MSRRFQQRSSSSSLNISRWGIRYRSSSASSVAPSFTNLADDGALMPIRGWVTGVEDHLEPKAVEQLRRIASMSAVVRHPVAAMPDLHLGNGVAVGAVIPTTRAIIPSAVGVDIGCGMNAVRTSMKLEDLPSDLEAIRFAIERAVPHGRTHNGRPQDDAGGWRDDIPRRTADAWRSPVDALDVWKSSGRATGNLVDQPRQTPRGKRQTATTTASADRDGDGMEERFKRLCVKHPSLERANHVNHLGTLGTGNHFVELSADESGRLWVMLHSGSRGVGNRIGQYFIEAAKKDMGKLLSTIPDAELAYVREGTELFDDYVDALQWAQDFARVNRLVMMANVLDALRAVPGLPKNFTTDSLAVNCHHNYVEKYALPASDEGGKRNNNNNNNNSSVWLIRKGATSARRGELAIIPGSMGAASFIVRGKGCDDAYNSCSHGAGRAYSRGEAMRRFTLDDHIAATSTVCCRKDAGVVDETPMAYKSIEKVMGAQAALVEIVHTLRQLVCVKG